MRKSDREYLQVGKAAEELGVHPITIGGWMKMGKIQAVRVGSEARIPRAEIDRLTNRHGKFRLCFMGRDESAVPCLGQGRMGFHFSTAVRE
jgi:putative resolvase